MKRLALVAGALIVLGMASTALAKVTLSGKYQTVIRNDPLAGGALNGTWVIDFKSGMYHVTWDGRAVVHGKFTISGHQLAIKDTGGQVCPRTGKYKLKLSGKTLTFKRISDSNSFVCAARISVLSHRFKKL